ncbi:type II toxin-antitoxin system VapB family antitoxin [Nocardioides sp.]|uniref:type II toxin-antitoxin system VapB family antitoxin n=1 Tax=Nocardioides sp. TaxID=35761 RepID=UPI00286A6C42|nr:type II toxin-antitoxin system VapB family antitoxin [Nocardioides sp.]
MDGRIGVVPTLNIKDPEVYRLAAALAARRGTSMTGAVRQALEEATGRDREERDGLAERLLAWGRHTQALSDEPVLTDDDLYDQRGLPR